jgi:hypothetical protein
VGSEVEATVERFSSHGAYVLAGDARGYVPLRNLAHPAPRSAREVLDLGERRRFVVIAVDAPRRGIDLALPGVVAIPATPAAPVEEQVVEALGLADAPAPAKAPARKAKATVGGTGATRAATKKAAAKTSRAPKRAPRKAPAKATVATKSRARKAAATTGAAKKAPTRKAPTKTATTDKATKKAPAMKAAAKKARRQ